MLDHPATFGSILPIRYCLQPGCPKLVDRGFCVPHQRPIRQQNRRFHTGPLNYGRRWRRERDKYLALHPMCICGCGGVATDVDHVVPHRGDPVLFWDPTNWQAMAHDCHARKTAREMRGDATGGRTPPPGGGSRNVA